MSIENFCLGIFWKNNMRHQSAGVLLAVVAIAVLTGFAGDCRAGKDSKEADVRKIGEMVGIRDWANERVRLKDERLEKVAVIFWQQVESSWPDVPVQARREIEAVVQEYLSSAQDDGSVDNAVHIWEEALSAQLSPAEAGELRKLYESSHGRKLLESVGIANEAVAGRLNSAIERKMEFAYRKLLEDSARIQQKYFGEGR